ncbi:hypothetical protein VB712_19830 [Spirulina sp. CCNP1310]|uniref:WD40 repeat domain-containing protein n=1 Tax=Spirulina sp. CCNP1310 TaxID=3110249 RepID=UPI002B20D837|nr:hypothetical protein [Spirulina sp. CCNP1310]MEA5421478.1 hypothetical protein [Spirulina sp. CCNP1310]
MGVQLQTSPGMADLVLGNRLAVAPLDGLVLGNREWEMGIQESGPWPIAHSPLYLRDLSPDLAEAVRGLLDASPLVQRRAYRLLRDLPHPQVQKILRSLLPYGLFAQLCEIRVGEHLAVSASGKAIAHHTPQGLLIQTLANQRILYRIPGQPSPCLLSGDGQTLIRILGQQEPSLELWQGGEQQPTPPISGLKTVALVSEGMVGASCVSAIIAYRNGQVDRWHLATGKLIQRLPPTRHGSLLTLALSADGQTLATAHTGQRVRIVPPNGRPYTLPIPAHHLALATDGQTLATAHPNQGIRLWDVVRGQPLGMLRSPAIGRINTLAFTPNGRVLATVLQTSQGPHQIQFWDLHQGDCIQTLTAAGGPITQMVFAAQGHALLTAHSDQQLRLWAVP